MDKYLPLQEGQTIRNALWRVGIKQILCGCSVLPERLSRVCGPHTDVPRPASPHTRGSGGKAQQLEFIQLVSPHSAADDVDQAGQTGWRLWMKLGQLEELSGKGSEPL
eukprot:Mycagemm_TRINITY_DN9799_c0_g1::TRINITY_DN9799_c0_g1_i1::g.4805::m.4805 type:complete len:108 gc:universal TRINITY_DN9799_c0_g1_i1:377-54(-)